MKYSKYFIHELPDEPRFKGFAKMPVMVAAELRDKMVFINADGTQKD
jgi:hypothetical protein